MNILSILSYKVKDKKDENSIKHYLDIHDDLPLWVLINHDIWGSFKVFFCFR